MYFEMCWEWHEKLSVDDQELVLTLADVAGSAQGSRRGYGGEPTASAQVPRYDRQVRHRCRSGRHHSRSAARRRCDPQVISDRDIWTAALAMVKRYGDDALFGALSLAARFTDWEEACTLFEPSLPPCS
jgi:hypothetical protein